MPEIKDVSKLLFMAFPYYNSCSAKNTANFKECVDAVLFYNKKGAYHRIDGCNWNCELALKKGMTVSACFKETQYTISLQKASWNNDSMYASPPLK